MENLEPAVVILSGGMDSATVLGLAVKQLGVNKVAAISFDYGQRHKVELDYARALAQHYKVDHEVICLPELRKVMKGSSQTDDSVPVPHGHYEDKTMEKTVVPNRNMILISIAAAYAISRGWNVVLYGAHQGDHAIYPDCRDVFVKEMRAALKLCHYYPIKLLAPYNFYSKSQIVKDGAALEVPYVHTYSCYEGKPIQCGKCGTCVERKESFINAGIPDPSSYESAS